MNERAKQNWDLIAIVALSALLVVIIYLVPVDALRIALGLPFILFFPGYALLAFLFPERKSLDLIERVALSFGLSIAITPLIGFGLNFTPFGIRLEPILASLGAFDAAFCALAWWRRGTVAEPYLPFSLDQVRALARSSLSGGTKLDRALTVILVIAIAASLITLVYVVAVPRQGESFTEFYILGPGGMAADYPHNLTVGQNASIIVGVANHEHREVSYTAQLWLINSTFINNQTVVHKMYYFDSITVTLPHVEPVLEGSWTPQWQQHYNFSVAVPGDYKMWFFLFMDGVPTDLSGLVKMQDYAASDSFYVQQAVSGDLQSLSLRLSIT
jgi:uncharacterized membrane protein